MRARVFIAAFAMVIALVPALAAAQEPDIGARATIDVREPALGERVRIAVVVEHPDNVLVNIDPPANSDAIRAVEAPPPTTEPGTSGGPSLTRFEFVIAAFALGPRELPPLRLSWIDENGRSGERALAVPPFTVASRVAPNDSNPRPLKPQLEVGGAPFAWQVPAAAAAVVVAVLLAALAALRLRRPRPAPAPALDTTVLAIEDDARRRLQEMARGAPLLAGDYDAYYGTISGVIRSYLQERFEFRATAMTTQELERLMTRRGVERWQARLVGGLLDRCDAAVYAGQRPDPASADHDLTVAFEIIELSRPQAEDEPAPAEVVA